MYKAAIAAAIGLSACLNQSGNLGATNTGDTSRPAQRGSPVDELRNACNEVASATALQSITRQPYLQQVTTNRAMIGWVTTNAAGAHVKLSDVKGGSVATEPGVVERYALRTPEESQLWSTLANLSTGSTYCYEIGDDTGPLTSRTGFRTAPAPEDTKPVRFLAFGDSGGGGTDQYALLEQMYTVPFELMIHTGDIAYDSGKLAEFEDNVFSVYADLWRNIPFFPTSGNHDYSTDGGEPFRRVFNLPGNSGEKWYSYDWGRVHFVALDTEASYEKQAEWLEGDLAANKLPWKIVYLHRPPYSSGLHGSDDRLRKTFAPLFERYRVQLVLAGHDHDYERMQPQNGVAYVVTGGGGKGTRSVGTSSFTAFSADVIHFVFGEVGVDELVLHAIDATGREFDSLVIPRG